MDMGTALGRVMTHEFGHWALQMVENRLTPGPLENGNMAPGFDPILMTGMATLTPTQISGLRSKSQKLHGGGGNIGGGGGDTTFTFAPIIGTYCSEGSCTDFVALGGFTVVIVHRK